MRTHVEFRSGAFPADADEDELLNPGLHGRALATWLGGELRARGIDVTEPIAEDWGWVIPISHPAFRLWVGCGNVEDRDDEYLCFTEPSTPTTRKGFKKVDTTAVLASLTDAMDDALRQHPEVHDVRWWTAAELGR